LLLLLLLLLVEEREPGEEPCLARLGHNHSVRIAQVLPL
jgi:hypothetical protein